MKALYIFSLCSLFFIVGCQPKKGTAQQESGAPNEAKAVVASAAQPSPHFEAVLKHLDVGGKALHFEDHEGQREMWIGLMELIQKAVPESGAFENVDPAVLVDELGLCSAVASGRSLAKDGDQWLLRHYSHHPEGMPEVMGLIGDAKDFVLPTLPASTDVAFEGRLDARGLPKLMRRFAKLMGSEEDLEEGFKEKLPIGLTLEGVMSQASMDVLLGMEFTKTDSQEMPVMPKAFVLKIRTEKSLVAACKPLLGNVLGDAKDMGGLMGWEVPVPPMPGMEAMKPVLLFDGDDTLVAVSSLEYWKAIKGSGDKLSGNSVYQAATNHFPKSGNMQVYLSPMVATAAREWAQIAMKENEELSALEDALVKLTPGKPWSLCISCGKNGISTLAEMPFALDASATTAMVAMSATSTLFVGARSWKRGSDRAGCIMNIRNVQQAIRGHQGMNALDVGADINWDDIFGPKGYLKEPKCPDGGIYTFAKTIPEVGVLACTCSHADNEKGHEPENHEDW